MKMPPQKDRVSVMERASRYLAKLPISVSGENGHDRLFYAACQMVLGFDLPKQDAFLLLATEYNPRCKPKWSDRELHHKVNEADKQEGERGYLLGDNWEPSSNGHARSEKKTEPNTENAVGILGKLMGRLRAGEGDILYDAGGIFTDFEVGPQKITVVGAPPGAGKTAITMQFVFELLDADPDVKITLANAEMPFESLLKRELTRRSGVPGDAIRFADCTPQQLADVETAANSLVPLVERITPMGPPFTNEALSGLLTHDPQLLILDYLQKFGSGEDARQATNDVIGTLRTLAHAGWAVLALSATARSKKGHASSELSLASFKESGEIEFNADLAYLLRDEGPSGANENVRLITLECAKNRHGARKHTELLFDAPHMTFSLRGFDFGEGEMESDF